MNQEKVVHLEDQLLAAKNDGDTSKVKKLKDKVREARQEVRQAEEADGTRTGVATS